MKKTMRKAWHRKIVHPRGTRVAGCQNSSPRGVGWLATAPHAREKTTRPSASSGLNIHVVLINIRGSLKVLLSGIPRHSPYSTEYALSPLSVLFVGYSGHTQPKQREKTHIGNIEKPAAGRWPLSKKIIRHTKTSVLRPFGCRNLPAKTGFARTGSRPVIPISSMLAGT